MIYFATACALGCIIGCLFVGSVGVILTYFIQTEATAIGLAKSYFVYFNGLLVGGLGCGAFWYVKTTQLKTLAMLDSIIDYNDGNLPRFGLLLNRVDAWHVNGCVGVIVMAIGGFVLWSCGYPHKGFAKYFLATTSISMYFVGGHILSQFANTIMCFRYIEKNINDYRLLKSYSTFDVEYINLSITISATFGVVALYVAFRGTITADFTYTNQYAQAFKSALLFPMVLFAPVLIFYNFYPKMVLKKLQEQDMIRCIKEVESAKKNIVESCDNKEKELEIERIYWELRDRIFISNSRLSLIKLKDYPALITASLMIIQYLIQRDPVVLNFLEKLVG